ncbi:uncharacterized protein LOC129829558 isoform X2 [Salvelinus fontinalis]|uniref:uncharacterized protein LOC129829558 isoform X2 n=1 Tax=Salvelinus fontinalis TaxID=8038 RepID=UPI0024855DA0|nr:uncharacterized protein LOC129829558 isoform X2 [Salvelinus fontinalis]
MHASTLRTLHQTSAVMLCLTSSFSPVVLFTNTHDWLNCSGELRTTNEQDKDPRVAVMLGPFVPDCPYPRAQGLFLHPAALLPAPPGGNSASNTSWRTRTPPTDSVVMCLTRMASASRMQPPKVENKEWVTFCVEHFRWNAMALQAQLRKASSGPFPEAFLSLLSGYNCTETHEQDSGRSEASLILVAIPGKLEHLLLSAWSHSCTFLHCIEPSHSPGELMRIVCPAVLIYRVRVSRDHSLLTRPVVETQTVKLTALTITTRTLLSKTAIFGYCVLYHITYS